MGEKDLSPVAVYSALPTVRVGGQNYPMVTELLLSMELTEKEGGMSALEMRVSNLASDPLGGAGLAFEDDKILKLGAQVSIYGGDENAPIEIFRGTITGLEADFPDGAPELLVLAEDVLQMARMARRSKVWNDLTVSDLAGSVASQLNLAPVITAFTDHIGTWVQFNESDLAFLRRILSRYDGDLQVVGSELHVSPRKDVLRGTIDLDLHGQLRKAKVLVDLAHQATEITVSGWDHVQGQRVKATSSGANLGPGSGRTGGQILQDAIGARSEHVGYPAILTDDEAQAMADAVFDKGARSLVCVEGTTEGNPALRVGTNLKLSGLGGRFNNTYYVTRACHRYDLSSGYETDFEAQCSYLGGS
jgi:Bacteriophage probable baseplate hub protein